jgi:hypothetical protein
LNLKSSQLSNQPRPDDETDDKGGQNRADRSEGNVTEDIEKGERTME